MHGNADSLSRRPGLPVMTEPIDDDHPPTAVLAMYGDCVTAINAAYAPEILEIANKEELKRHQEDDQEIQKAVRHENSAWKSKELIKKNEIWMTRGNRVVLPTSLLTRAVHKAHKIAAHRGQAATLSVFQTSMDSPHAKQAIEAEIKHCLECQTKSLPRPQKALFRPKTAQGAFQLWSMDFVGPLPPSTQRRYTYIQTMIDVFTKWPEAFPCHGPTAAVVIHHLLHDIFPRFGLPQMLHSDRGTHFTAKVVQETANKLGITTTTTPAYHPQSNPVERFNQDLGRGLSALAGRAATSWAEHVPAILTAARITPHRGTKFSPYELVLGRTPPLARSLWPTLDWGDDVKARDLGKLEEQAMKNLREYHQSKEKYYKGEVKGFLPGTRVCLFTPVLERGTSSKFKAMYWTYPWEVVDRISELTYRIKSTGETNHLPSPQVVSVDRLRLYKDGTTGSKPRAGRKRKAGNPTDIPSRDQEGSPDKSEEDEIGVSPGNAQVSRALPAMARAVTPKKKRSLTTPRGSGCFSPPPIPPRGLMQGRPPAPMPRGARGFQPTRTSTAKGRDDATAGEEERPKSRGERDMEEIRAERTARTVRERIQAQQRRQRRRRRSGETQNLGAEGPEGKEDRPASPGQPEEGPRGQDEGEEDSFLSVDEAGSGDETVVADPDDPGGPCNNQ